jgi:hypothetical protein
MQMENLSESQVKRQDFVDGEIFQLIQKLNPTKKRIEWNIEMIGDIRDTIEEWMVKSVKSSSRQAFYPFLEP